MPARLFGMLEPGPEPRARLDAAQARHLRALRLKAGDTIHVIVGPAREHRAVIERLDRDGAVVRLGAEEPATFGDPSRPLALAVGLADLVRLDLVVEKATELGATRVTPFVAARSQLRTVHEERLARWRRIALAACEQCGRSSTPELRAPISFEDLLSEVARSAAAVAFDRSGDHAVAELATVLRDRSAPTSRSGPRPPLAGGLLAVVGPEGGLVDRELAALRDNGALVARLGPRTLRFETAAIAALVALSVALPE